MELLCDRCNTVRRARGPTLQIAAHAATNDSLPSRPKFLADLGLTVNTQPQPFHGAIDSDQPDEIHVNLPWPECCSSLDGPWIRTAGDGKIYIMPGLDSERVFSSLSTLYLVSFALGTLVRGFPTVWFALITRQQDDTCLPLLQAALEVIQSEIPALILRELEVRPAPDNQP